MKKVAGDYTDKNFDERDRNSHSDRHQTRDERERHPDCSDEPDVLKDDVGGAETEPNVIKHNKTPACALLREQESLALKRSARFSRNREGKLHCLSRTKAEFVSATSNVSDQLRVLLPKVDITKDAVILSRAKEISHRLERHTSVASVILAPTARFLASLGMTSSLRSTS